MAMQFKVRLKNGPVDPEKVTGKVREVFDDILRVRGIEEGDKGIASGINILWTTYGHSPTTLERNWFSNAKAMRSGNVSYNMKQSIAIVVATTWGCDGWAAYHQDALRVEGEDIETIKAIRSIDPSLPERERAVFELVQQAVIDVTQITAEDVMRLSDLGWSDSDIVEMIDVAAFAIGEALFGDVLIEVLDESGKKFKLE